MKKILDSIEKTETTLTELLDACADYRNAIKEKDYAKAQEAMSVFEDCTETKNFRLSIEPPIQCEDDLFEVFGDAVFG